MRKRGHATQKICLVIQAVHAAMYKMSAALYMSFQKKNELRITRANLRMLFFRQIIHRRPLEYICQLRSCAKENGKGKEKKEHRYHITE